MSVFDKSIRIFEGLEALNLSARPNWERSIRTNQIALFTCTDPGRDPDDEVTALLMKGLSELGAKLYLLGMVANMAPSVQRAALLNGEFERLQMPLIPVAIGSDAKQEANPKYYEFDCEYINFKGTNNGKEQFYHSFMAAKDNSISLLLLSALTDIAEFITENPNLAVKKLKNVAIMGGVTTSDGKVLLDQEGHLIPDPSASNHAFDIESAKLVYEFLQKNQIPMTIVSRYAALAAPVPREVYDLLAETNHPVGIRLKNMQKESIEGLWQRTHLPISDPKRELPQRCTTEWFCNQYLDGIGKDLPANADIWPLVKHFMLYDPITLIAVIPELCAKFFEPTNFIVNNTVHKIIGIDQFNSGVKDPRSLVTFLSEALLEGLRELPE